MRILMLAPQPYYSERGTPIAIDVLVRELSKKGHEIDLVTCHLGDDRDYPGVRIFRVRPWPQPAAIPIGFSWSKVYSDLFMWSKARSLLRLSRYDVIHAVEESVFVAMLLHRSSGVRYVYDMDSWMSSQLCERFVWARPFRRLMEGVESMAIKRAAAVVPMCDSLAERAGRFRDSGIHVLWDVSLRNEQSGETVENLRDSLGLSGSVVMYIGNLEPYQGIDLLLESFARVEPEVVGADLVVIGGQQTDIERYVAKARQLGIGKRVHFVGPRPVAAIGDYMDQADLLVSPRVGGTNTPMKVYSYMDSGRALLATDLWTHTQVLDSRTAALAPPEAAAFAAAMSDLLQNPGERERLARGARRVVAERHSQSAFATMLGHLMEDLERDLACPPSASGA